MGPEETYGNQTPAPYVAPDDPKAKRKRLLIGVGGLLIFVVILFIGLSLLFSTPTIRPDIAKIAAQQNEIARVAALGVDSEDARRDTQNLAANVKAVAITNVAELDNWAEKNLASDFTKGELTRENNSQTDAALLEAGAVNNYQEVFEEAMLALLEGSNRQIKTSLPLFDSYPKLQESLNNIGFRNQSLIDSISSE